MGIQLMKRYARIENNKVVEFIETDNDISQMFHSDLVWVDIEDQDIYYNYSAQLEKDAWVFSKPTEVINNNQSSEFGNRVLQDSLIKEATLKIDVLLDSTNTSIVSDVDKEDIVLLKKWKQYRVALNKVNTKIAEVDWPVPPA